MTRSPVVLLDANVLFSALMRDVLVQLALTGLFAARWTKDIQREWLESVLSQYPDLRRERLERTSSEMESAIEGSLVADYEPLLPELTLPDPDDRHVLAAAIAGRCDFIATSILAIFPRMCWQGTVWRQSTRMTCYATCWKGLRGWCAKHSARFDPDSRSLP